MTPDEAYRLKGFALTQIEIWQNEVRKANEVINQDLIKNPTAEQAISEKKEVVENPAS